MDAAAAVTRMRWRLRGAWLWPSFIVLMFADGVIENWRPVAGDHSSVLAGLLLGSILSLIGIAMLSPALGWVLRQVRQDLPTVVARDYAGAGVCLLIACLLLGVGVIHHPAVVADQNALEDASATAEAYIGDHAPQRFMAGLHSLSAYEVQPPEIYRVCARAAFKPGLTSGPIWYCVSVDRSKPFGDSVTYAGSESNALLSQGTN